MEKRCFLLYWYSKSTSQKNFLNRVFQTFVFFVSVSKLPMRFCNTSGSFFPCVHNIYIIYIFNQKLWTKIKHRSKCNITSLLSQGFLCSLCFVSPWTLLPSPPPIPLVPLSPPPSFFFFFFKSFSPFSRGVKRAFETYCKAFCICNIL